MITKNDTPKFPEVSVELVGQDGNVGNLMGIVTRAMKEAGVDREDIAAFRTDVFDCGSYDEVLTLIGNTVSIDG